MDAYILDRSGNSSRLYVFTDNALKYYCHGEWNLSYVADPLDKDFQRAKKQYFKVESLQEAIDIYTLLEN